MYARKYIEELESIIENKKWTDADLRTAFEDSCKFTNFKDLQDFLLKNKK
jgi:hypothetical protein